MKENSDRKAVIYCRVSSVKQVTEGHGLGSQETRCREYAAHKRYAVAEVFQDEGVSGGLIDRPGMQAMLSFLKKHRRRSEHIVIIDDISRLARGLEAHLQLRSAISQAGGKLESPSIEFGEDSDSILVEETPEGLQIQLVDQEGRSMFPPTGVEPYQHTRRLLAKMGPVLKALPNRIQITGHTDAARHNTKPGYSLWDLSADRAKAVRRILAAAGLP